MEGVYIIGIDLAKNSFQLHGARADGSVAYRRKLTRAKVLGFLASQPRCVVAMEACAGAHHWGRALGRLGHEVKLLPPAYVKPYVKRHKNDAADAEAISEAATRPTIRPVAVKSEEQQTHGMLYRTRALLVGHRTRTINALRSHLAEFGVVARQGPVGLTRLVVAVRGAESGLPEAVRELGEVLLEEIAGLKAKIEELERRLCASVRDDEEAQRLMSIPGVGDPGVRAADGELPSGPGLLGLAGSGPPAAHHGGQAPPGADIEDGPARREAAVDHVRDVGDSPGRSARRAAGFVAGPDAGAQASYARRGGAGQQDGAHRVGAAAEQGVLQGTGAPRLSGARIESGGM